MKKIFLVLLVLLLTSPLYADIQDIFPIGRNFENAQILVKTGTSDTKPTQLTSTTQSIKVILSTKNTSSILAVGGANVTTATGLYVTGNYLTLDIGNPSSLYVAAGPATASISYFIIKR